MFYPDYTYLLLVNADNSSKCVDFSQLLLGEWIQHTKGIGLCIIINIIMRHCLAVVYEIAPWTVQQWDPNLQSLHLFTCQGQQTRQNCVNEIHLLFHECRKMLSIHMFHSLFQNKQILKSINRWLLKPTLKKNTIRMKCYTWHIKTVIYINPIIYSNSPTQLSNCRIVSAIWNFWPFTKSNQLF